VGERFGGLRRWAAEHQHGSIGRVREGAGYHQLAAIMGFLEEREMFGAKRDAAFHIIVHHVIEQKKVHEISSLQSLDGLEEDLR